MELWDAYLQDESLAGTDLVRGEPIPKGLYHLVCQILVRHIDGEYLLMQRDLNKPNYPGFYEATAGGSALKGEDKFQCAYRELAEETGIKAENMEIIGRFVSKDTIYYQFLCVTDCRKDSILLQKEETISYHWITEEEFISFVNSNQMIPSQKTHYLEYFKKLGYIK